MAGNPTPRCPGCNRYGTQKLGGWCKSCHGSKKRRTVEKDKKTYRGHIGETYINDYDFMKPLVPTKFGIVKDKVGIVR